MKMGSLTGNLEYIYQDAVRAYAGTLKPVVARHWAALAPALQPLADKLCLCVDSLLEDINASLGLWAPWQLVLLTVVATALLSWVLDAAQHAKHTLQDKGVTQVLARLAFRLPVLRGIVAAKEQKVVDDLEESMKKGAAPDALHELPPAGTPAADLKRRLGAKGLEDHQFKEGASTVSGVLYMAGREHLELLEAAYSTFSMTNPMHANLFPAVRRMEVEVVRMTASILGGGPLGDPGVCGAMTSGGTESILTAVKASRDYMAATRGITSPEMIVAVSAHAAFIKAAEYFGIRLIRLPVGKDYRLGGRAVRRAISRNTVLVVASAPGFPHGVMDHVTEIAAAAAARGVPCHVDCCLGGFVLPFAARLGRRVPPFDFSVPGVTSISADTHKFGQGHKGTSVVLYRSKDIRKYQYTSITDWTGGLYISPGFAGSRSGALIATAWASLVHLGEDGFLEATSAILAAADEFQAGVRAIPGMEVLDSPEGSVVAVRSTNRSVDIYEVNDLMTRRGWHLSPLQSPPAVHICFTAAHTGPDTVRRLVDDLAECTAEVAAAPGTKAEGGTAPMYGAAAAMPDRSVVGRFLVAYQDLLLDSC
ncbi:hypothetical protein ACKKBG_A14975 [Auxenochlorella protothecoides x Auxenochlorella symbiontica]|uniref:sphinganine-1-phosphate aldolase n=1 Tax=Auxenochlorella protothecoides TaxID=3075 RepID=A0A087SHS1_AUXPR|nr:Sphingosine-1-phosphate lyase [Auxenochlorella protothecoides]KFM25275.1 Sphingosine-1-phosphate lyase [Auxenochlorella protothecoides]RMZ57662.1 hypothetical protein APUTEX25_001862 [Auxenochlorella protothecoides]|eukprot:RMZ57662.1 hypothetical protein APUTEX25_001862 [Auxenochlorella protothecoides]